MKKLMWGLVSLILLLPAVTLAAPRALLTVTEIMEINAAPVEVWNVIKAFDGIGAWIPVVAKCKLSEGANGKTGAVRHVELKNGWLVDEELAAYSDDAMTFSYSLFDGPFPVDNYVATTSVRPNKDGTGSIMIWTSGFQRKNPSANPPEGESDAGLIKALSGIYKESMGIIKKAVEKK